MFPHDIPIVESATKCFPFGITGFRTVFACCANLIVHKTIVYKARQMRTCFIYFDFQSHCLIQRNKKPRLYVYKARHVHFRFGFILGFSFIHIHIVLWINALHVIKLLHVLSKSTNSCYIKREEKFYIRNYRLY